MHLVDTICSDYVLKKCLGVPQPRQCKWEQGCRWERKAAKDLSFSPPRPPNSAGHAVFVKETLIISLIALNN